MTVSERVHTSAGVAITNEARDLFYIQQKDEFYPIPDFRLLYAFFGGAIKDGEDGTTALKRELLEELREDVANLIYEKSKKMFDSGIILWKQRKSRFLLFESVLPTEKLLHISKLPIKEGKKGCLISRDELADIPVIPTLEGTRDRYLSNLL